MNTSGPCPWDCGEVITIEEGQYGVCPKCGQKVKGIPDRVSSGKATGGQKISFDEFHKFIVEEVAHLLELEISGADMTSKKEWLTSLLPEKVIEETLEKAKRMVKGL